MTIKIPNSIKIGPHICSIKEGEKEKERNGGSWIALNEPMLNRIWYLMKENGEILPDSQLVTNLLHEVIHLIDSTCGTFIFKGPLSEERIDALATHLYQVFVENPDFLELFKK